MLLNLPDTQSTVYSSFPFQLEKAHKDGFSLICLYSSQSDSEALHINVPESTIGCGSLEKRPFYSIRTLLGLFFIKCKWFFCFILFWVIFTQLEVVLEPSSPLAWRNSACKTEFFCWGLEVTYFSMGNLLNKMVTYFMFLRTFSHILV